MRGIVVVVLVAASGACGRYHFDPLSGGDAGSGSDAGVSCANHGLGGMPAIATKDASTDVEFADLDGDGDLDSVVTDINGPTVEVSLNRGNGTFAAPVLYTTQMSPNKVAIGDVTGDGTLDLVVVTRTGWLCVLTGLGGGTFSTSNNRLVGTDLFGVALGDLDGNGSLDVAIVDNPANSVVLAINMGNGTFTPSALSAGSGVESVAIGDLDGDGTSDLVVANNMANNVGVLLNQGGAVFNAMQTYATGTRPLSVRVADINRDGLPDVVVGNNGDNSVGVLLNSGGGALLPQVTSAVGMLPSAIAVADLDRDGALDVVATNINDDTVSVLRGAGTASFTPTHVYDTALGVQAGIEVADVDADGILDIAIASFDRAVVLMRGRGDASFVAPVSYILPDVSEDVQLADLDKDGKLDVIASTWTSVSVLRNVGDGQLAAPVRYFVASIIPAIVVADFNEDGNLDVAAVSSVQNEVYLLRGDGAGGLLPATTIASGRHGARLDVADQEHDGHLDLLVSGATSDSTILYGSGNGTFPNATVVGTSPNATVSAIFTDLDHDDLFEVAALDRSGMPPHLNWFPPPLPTALPVTLNASVMAATITAADVDNDGDIDVVSVSQAGPIETYLNDGGMLRPAITAQTFNAAVFEIALRDVTGDNIVDVIGALQTSPFVVVMPGLGDGTFGAPSLYSSVRVSVAIAVGDLNGDGRNDVVTTSNGVGTVGLKVLLDTCLR